MFASQHCGLYFTDEHLKQAHKNSDREPVKTALAFLRSHQPGDDAPAMQLDGLRYRLDGDLHAGEQVVSRLERVSFEDDLPYLESLANTLTLTQCFETARDHPSFSADSRARWLAGLRERVAHFNQPIYAADYTERLCLGALNTGAGIALENEDIFNAGVEVFRQAIHDDIRPDGYITRAVDDPELKGDGQSLYRQLLAVQALALTAEAASHAGVDLWEYHHRGVSVITAATYLIYYYFYPENWPWDEGLELEPTQALFREHSGFLEMVNRRNPPRGIRRLLDDLRPIFDPYGGGLTTLTHGAPRRRGLFR